MLQCFELADYEYEDIVNEFHMQLSTEYFIPTASSQVISSFQIYIIHLGVPSVLSPIVDAVTRDRGCIGTR